MDKINSQIIMYGAPWCPFCVSLKAKLEKRNIKFIYKNVDDEGVRDEMSSLTNGNQTIPVLFVGEIYKINPSEKDLKEVLMSESESSQKTYDVIMIGAGPTSLAAAIYTAREDI